MDINKYTTENLLLYLVEEGCCPEFDSYWDKCDIDTVEEYRFILYCYVEATSSSKTMFKAGTLRGVMLKAARKYQKNFDELENLMNDGSG